MNAKYALALILTLQVSMCLCQLPTPSPELALKYDNLKTTFFKRLMMFAEKFQAQVAPLAEQIPSNENTNAFKEHMDELQTRPEFQAVVKFAGGLAREASPLLDKARSAALGLYQKNFRSKYQSELDKFINDIKPFLDRYLPAE